MASELKAIETQYKGYRFRSRLEARWAVFFDALGIEWEYEKEGYDLGKAGWYLPDFWLPSFEGGMWVEVKPDNDDWDKAHALCSLIHQNVWLAEGYPDLRGWWYLHPSCTCDDSRGGDVSGCRMRKGLEWDYEDCVGCVRAEWHINEVDGIPGFDSADGEDRMFVQPGYLEEGMRIPLYMLNGISTLERAVEAARSARFEHGECGAPGGK